jgi:hypothetical protein
MRRVSIVFVLAALVCASSMQRPVLASSLPPGLSAALAANREVADCAKVEKRSLEDVIAKDLAVESVRLARGLTVYRVDAHAQCFCGNINCLLLAFADTKGDGSYRELVSATSEDATFTSDGGLVIEAHSSAAVRERTTYRFDGSTYSTLKQELVLRAPGTSKPIVKPLGPVAIRFAVGASSATLHSTAYLDLPDTYVFDAAKGQTMDVSFAVKSGDVDVFVSSDGGSTLVANFHTTTWRGTLPKTGRYQITVSGSSDERAAEYAMTVAIH